MTIEVRAEPGDQGKRLDSFLHERLPEYSRSRLQSWIKESRVRVNGTPAKSSATLRGGEMILVESVGLPPLQATAEEIPLEILYEDEACIAINKPAGMVVHTGAGVHSGTLVNALLYRFQQLSRVGGEMRPGIVHRLDRFTSGVLLVAKTDSAHLALAKQFASRSVEKIYLALVEGRVEGSGTIDKPITRDPRSRARMTARLGYGRHSITHWEALETGEEHTLLRIRIGTGRTHQIRAHMSAIGHPVAGDRLYGARPSPFERYFLHAFRLTFDSPAVHPKSQSARVSVEAPLPADLQDWLASLKR